MIIGNFKHDSKTNTYRGDISTLSTSLSVRLIPNEKSGDKEPDYRLIKECASGTVELGAAWKRTSDKGRAFLSVTIDDPVLPSMLNAALFSGENDTAMLVWSRSAKAKAKPKKS